MAEQDQRQRLRNFAIVSTVALFHLGLFSSILTLEKARVSRGR